METDSEQQKPAEPSKSKRATKPDAYKVLRQAVGERVREQTSQIADSLVKHTIGGNSNTARIVVSLVDKRRGKKPAQGKPKRFKSKLGRSVAINLASEPEYEDPTDEAKAETTFGPREPEKN